MPWKPITPHHAIERVRVNLQFKTPLSDKMVVNLSRLVEGLPQDHRVGDREKSIQQGLQIIAGPQGHQITNSQSSGFVFRRRADQGAVIEALVIAPDRFSYEVVQYTRWTHFLDRFWTISEAALKRLADDADIQAFSLEYLDKFNFAGSLEDAIPSTLLAADLLGALPRTMRSTSGMWHVHRGWFEEFGGAKFLVNQNFDAQDGRLGQDATKVLRSVYVATAVSDVSVAEGKSAEAFRDELVQMHNLSAQVVRDALCEEVKKEIGL